jgi:hypothetical protein
MSLMEKQLLATGSIQDSHGYPRRSRTRVLTMKSPSGRWTSGLGSTRPFSTPRGLSNPAITTPSHCAGIILSLATTNLEDQGPDQGLHSDNFSSVRSSFWRSRCTDALYARRMSSPKMTSFVILATNTQIFSGRAPVSLIKILPSRWGGLPQIPSTGHSVGSAVFRALWQPCGD